MVPYYTEMYNILNITHFLLHFFCWSCVVSFLRNQQLTSVLHLKFPRRFIVTWFQANIPSRFPSSALLHDLILSFHTQVFSVTSACEFTCHAVVPCTAYHRWALIIRLVYSQHAARLCNLSVCHTTSLRIGFKVFLVDSFQQTDAAL